MVQKKICIWIFFDVDMFEEQRETIRVFIATAQEVRSPDDHCIICWANMTTVGVLPAAKYDWFLTGITTMLSAHKRNGLAIIVHCNRASDPNRTDSFYPNDFSFSTLIPSDTLTPSIQIPSDYNVFIMGVKTMFFPQPNDNTSWQERGEKGEG